MPSFSRNKPAQALIIGISAALLGTVSHAAGDSRFTMTAYTNVLGGEEIVSGDYKAALAKLDSKSVVHQSDASVALNRCVALTMTAQWAPAQAACNTAVHYALLARTTHSEGGVQVRQEQDDTIALAYSDRAVLKWLTGDAKAATQDLQRAQTLSHDAALVTQNVNALSARSTLAEVRSAEQR